MKELPKDWKEIDFESCLEQDSTPSKIKIKRSDYKEKGTFPIIDQGQKFIAGYSNDVLKVFPNKGESVVFGDHTRIIKYVNFPFCVGADGTKVLRVKEDILIPKFFYYQLQWMPIENAGYSRHYRFLRRKKVLVPPLDVQRKIVGILEKAEDLINKRNQANLMTNKIQQTVFQEMFNENNAKAMTIGCLLENGYLLMHKDGNHGSSYPRSNEFSEEGVPFLTAKDIDDEGKVDTDGVSKLNYEKAAKLKIGWIEKGDVLLAHNASVGKVAFYKGEFERALIGTSLTAFRPNPKYFTSEYLFCALRSMLFQGQLAKIMKQFTRNQVPITAQRKMTIQVAAIETQLEFSVIFLEIENLRQEQQKSSGVIANLFDSLMSKAFNGELLTEVHPERQVTEQKHPSLVDFMNK